MRNILRTSEHAYVILLLRAAYVNILCFDQIYARTHNIDININIDNTNNTISHNFDYLNQGIFHNYKISFVYLVCTSIGYLVFEYKHLLRKY